MDGRLIVARFRSRFLVLWIASVIAIALVLPYALTLEQGALPTGVPLGVVAAAGLVQSAVLFAVATFLGLRAADATGLRTPLIDALAQRASVAAAWRSLRPLSAATWGVGVAAVIAALDFGLFLPNLPEFRAAANAVTPERWQGLLASFYGGIGEELLTRLFFVSALAWLLGRRRGGRERASTMWLANVGAAVLFGAGHLPAVATIAPLTPLIVTRTVLLNTLGGIVFGWLYWKRGLEAGMVAHFASDIVLHVIG